MCDCGCNNCEFSFSGLSGLLGDTSPGYTVAGSIIEWKGSVWAVEANSSAPTGSERTFGLNEKFGWDTVGELIEGCLYSTGGFSAIELSDSGWLTQTITIRVTLANDFADYEDVFNLISGTLWNCAGLNNHTDSFSILYVPESAPASVAQVGPRLTPFQNAPASGNQASAPSRCDWNKLSLTDYFACRLGLTPSSSALVGAGLALGGIVLLSVLVKR